MDDPPPLSDADLDRIAREAEGSRVWRADLLALVAEVRRLKAENGRLASRWDDLGAVSSRYCGLSLELLGGFGSVSFSPKGDAISQNRSGGAESATEEHG